MWRVRIIERSDNRGPDNRGSTVLHIVYHNMRHAKKSCMCNCNSSIWNSSASRFFKRLWWHLVVRNSSHLRAALLLYETSLDSHPRMETSLWKRRKIMKHTVRSAADIMAAPPIYTFTWKKNASQCFSLCQLLLIENHLFCQGINWLKCKLSQLASQFLHHQQSGTDSQTVLNYILL